MYRTYEDENPAAIILYSKKVPIVPVEVKKSDPAEKKTETETVVPAYLTTLQEGSSKAISKINGQPAVLTNLLVTGISEQVQTIAKVAQHFGGNWNVFFFGTAPTMMTINGKLLDSPDAPHYEGFRTIFDSHLAGGKPEELDLKVVLVIDSRVITGYFMGCQFGSGAEMTKVKDFSFSLLVRSSRFIRTGDKSMILGSRKMRNINEQESI